MKNHGSKLFALLLILTFTFGCSMINQFKKEIDKVQKPNILRSTDGSCQVTVPGTWRAETVLHPEAILQASSRLSEQYVIVLASKKEDFTDEVTLDSLTKLLRTGLSKNITQAETNDPVSTEINGYPAEQFEASGAVSGVKVKYIYTVIEAPEGFYQVLAWTLTSRFESNKNQLLDVVNSFQLAKDSTGDALPPPAIRDKSL